MADDEGMDRLAVVSHGLLTRAATVVEAATMLRELDDLDDAQRAQLLDVVERNARSLLADLQGLAKGIDPTQVTPPDGTASV